MPNVKFKRGLQSSLFTFQNHVPVIKSGVTIEDGTFYLTTDTNRLFVGNKKDANSSVELVELNKSITTVATVDDLPDADSGIALGQFYYITGPDNGIENTKHSNILAVWNGTTWIQVNPDTNDNDHLGSVSVEQLAKDSDGSIPYKLTFQMVDKVGQNKTGTQPSVTINVSAKDIISQIDAAVTSTVVNDSTNGNVATITTKIKNSTLQSNNLSTGSYFALKAGNNVTLSKNGAGQIEISTSIGTDSVKLAVDVADGKASQPTINTQVNGVNSGDTLTVKGDKDIKVTATAGSGADANKKTITIEHSNTATAQGTADAATLKNGGAFTAIVESNYDDYGHIASQKKQNITLPKIKANKITVDSDDKSKLKVSVTDQTGAVADADIATSDSILFYNITVDGTTSKKKNQDSLGSFYSAQEIDKKMRELDALTYRGTVASTSEIPTTEVEIGDTYKVSAANSGIKINNVDAKLGDLIIATGTEDTTTGYITSSTLQWTLVAGGTDDDTTYETKVTAGSTNVANVGIIASTAKGQFTQYVPFSGDDWVNINTTASSTENPHGAVAFAHKTSGVTPDSYGSNTAGQKTAGASIEIPSFTVDEKGHLTAADSVSIQLPQADKLGGTSSDKKIELQNNAGVALGSVTFANGNLTTTEVTINGINETVKVNHAKPTMGTNGSATKTPDLSSETAADRQVQAITNIVKDEYGHVTKIDTTTYTIGRIDDKLTHALTTNTNSVTVTADLQDYKGVSKGKSAFTIQSPNNTLSITNTENTDNINIDIVWGSF